jgi:hypothetical protein
MVEHGKAVIMAAVSRRVLLLIGPCLLLIGAVGWSSPGGTTGQARADSGVVRAGAEADPDEPINAQPLQPQPGLHPAHRASAASASPTRRASPAASSPPATVSLTDGWKSVPDPHNLGIAEDWGQGGGGTLPWAPVSLPNDYNASVSPTSDAGTVAWYEVQFKGPAITPGRAWRVAFESVRRNAQVWLNGYKIGSNSDPYAPFSLPATTLRPGQPNLLIVRVDSIRGASSLPEDWWNWGGIMGPVTLQSMGRLDAKDLGVTSTLGCRYRCGSFVVRGTVGNRTIGALPATVVARVTSPNGGTVTARQSLGKVRSGASVAINLNVPVRRPAATWSPQHPSLYTVRVQLQSSGGRIEERQTFTSGLRSVTVKNGVLYLNGRRLWLHGASIHEDMDGRGAALTNADIRTIVSELKSVGANVTRAHYLLSPRLLEALDRAGIMVWAQPPVDHADSKLRSVSGRSHALSLLRSTLLGNRSHPSVIIDSVGNELSPNPDAARGTRTYLQEATALARKLNPGVPVGLDTYCYPGYPAQKIYSSLDVLGISHYFGWYTGPKGHSIVDFNGLRPFLVQAHTRYPKLALAVSEFGAESRFDGPPSTKGTYQFQSNYVTQTMNVLDGLPFINGAIYWTLREFAVNPGWTGGVTLPVGTAPDGIHHKGLIAYDGTVKPAFSVAQQAFAKQPGFVH